MFPRFLSCAFALLGLAVVSAFAAEEPAPFQLKRGEYPLGDPPDGAVKYIAGELISVDHINRTGVLRVDRTDAQRRGDWDLPLPFTMLPFGSIRYHGAPAELRDIPIGTHLHGWFFHEFPQPKDAKPEKKPDAPKLSADAAFNLAFRLEDDFTHFDATLRTWKIDAIDLEKMTLTAQGSTAGTADAKPTIFQITPATRVRKQGAAGSLSDLAAGQAVTFNLTFCTLKGPGRIVDLWLDDRSREVARQQQLEVHRQFMREHGLPGIIDAVDNEQGIVTVLLFANFDTGLLDDFPTNEALAAAAKGPPFVPGPGLVDPIAVTGACAEESLRTYDQINDRKAGPMISIEKSAAQPGSTGVRIKFKPVVLLEGFRPQRIIRIWPSKWKVDDLPREERLPY